MAKENNLKVALAIQNIALAVDDQTLNKISDNLKTIENEFSKLTEVIEAAERFIEMQEEVMRTPDLTHEDKQMAKISAYECIKRKIKGTGTNEC